MDICKSLSLNQNSNSFLLSNKLFETSIVPCKIIPSHFYTRSNTSPFSFSWQVVDTTIFTSAVGGDNRNTQRGREVSLSIFTAGPWETRWNVLWSCPEVKVIDRGACRLAQQNCRPACRAA